MNYKISQSALDAMERINNPPKTPFTHEGLMERGFAIGLYGPYKMLNDSMTMQVWGDGGKSIEITYVEPNSFGHKGNLATTITTLEDLDLFLSYIKHD